MGLFDWLFGATPSAIPKSMNDLNKSAAIYNRAGAERGEAEAQYNYGVACLDGHVTKDWTAGMELLIKSANQNYLPAQNTLGDILLKGAYGCNQDVSKAINWYYEVAKQRPENLSDRHVELRASAISSLALIFAKGEGSFEFADRVLDVISANLDNVPNLYCFGCIYKNGLYGKDVDIAKAALYFHKMISFDIGNSSKLSISGRRIQFGYRDVNFDAVINFLNDAASNGIKEAQCALGAVYFIGWNKTTYDKDISFRLLNKASAQGDEYATELLLTLFPNRLSNPADIATPNLSANLATSNSAIVSPKLFRGMSDRPLSPFEYGFFVVKASVGSSEEALREIIGDNDTRIKQEISSKNPIIQLHIQALQIAVFMLCAEEVCSSRDVLTEISDGISTGLVALWGGDNNSEPPELASFTFEIFLEYRKALLSEINAVNNNDYSDFLDKSASTNLVVAYIGKQCGIERLLEENPIETLQIKAVVVGKGLVLLSTLIANKSVSYS
jgi:TPR repeat protein